MWEDSYGNAAIRGPGIVGEVARPSSVVEEVLRKSVVSVRVGEPDMQDAHGWGKVSVSASAAVVSSHQSADLAAACLRLGFLALTVAHIMSLSNACCSGRAAAALSPCPYSAHVRRAAPSVPQR